MPKRPGSNFSINNDSESCDHCPSSANVAPVKYTATVWREQIPWRRTDTLVSVTSTTGLFWIWEGINNKWVTTHTEAHPTMQCVLCLLFYPFTSPNFPAPFSGHLFFPHIQRLCTSTHCPDVFQVNIENGAEGRNPQKANGAYGLFRWYQTSPVCWWAHVEQMCPLAPASYLENCELRGIEWPLWGSAAEPCLPGMEWLWLGAMCLFGPSSSAALRCGSRKGGWGKTM